MQQKVDPSRIDDLAEGMKKLTSFIETEVRSSTNGVLTVASAAKNDYTKEAYVGSAAGLAEELVRDIRAMASKLEEKMKAKAKALNSVAEQYRKTERLAGLKLRKGTKQLAYNLSYNPKVYSEYVKTLQKRLREMGYDIEVDGKFGKETKAAVSAFKKKYGLGDKGKDEGVVGEQTWLYLFGTVDGALKYDPHTFNEQVRMAQIRLKELGYDVEVTGYFDKKTKAAVSAFKNKNHLGNKGTVEGVIGTNTWEVLFGGEALAKNAESVAPTASGGSVPRGKVVYYNQEDPKWGGLMYSSSNDKSQTIAKSACGPTSLAMILSTITGKQILPPDLSNWAVKHGYRTSKSGTSWGFFKAAAKQYDVQCVQTGSLDEVKKALKDGNHLVIASMGPGHFTGGGHFIVLTDVDTKNGEDWYSVLDPNMDNRAYKNDGKIQQGTKNDGSVEAVGSVFKAEAKQYWIFTYKDKAPTTPPPSNNQNVQNPTSGGKANTISVNGVKFLHGSEGYSAYKYKDQAGKWTIGYGHLIRPGEKFKEPMSQEEAIKLYEKDIQKFIKSVNEFQSKYNLKLTQNQFDALVSFTYNLGENIWEGKTTLKSLIVSGKYTDQELKEAFGRFCKADGKRSRGLYNRRIDEAEVFLYGEYTRRTDRLLP
ncbi:glycoside hydrolase family protein [Paenibacillus sp. CAA11]|uniref:glycoside hydrolase family protein n=1 Tax=Paenibacillus sp. CAA11 TaxID=1532905 RepID=UPI00131EE240|nr:peptidoglycan-binding protein [Paenibacillus sp. CAA11]